MSTVKEIRKINDELCKEYGLSVIEKPKKKGMSKYEWMMRRKGLSYKKLLQDNIDICISSSNSFEEFLQNMQKLGYEIKHGKHIAFRKSDKERFVRAKSFGHDYCEIRFLALYRICLWGLLRIWKIIWPMLIILCTNKR